ncbi:hypothetical protein GGR56DRAFT_677213 [Xylariaceae sp. FL0804]|nr:hypothetical protein GGR56DRAFT_677213 [Xylariaceae sp. FL0804]
MSCNTVHGQSTRILVLNPNSSKAMTNAMCAVIPDMGLPYSTTITAYTAPADTSPASINDADTIAASHRAVTEDLLSLKPVPGPRLQYSLLLRGYDGVVVACFSVHPLVSSLVQLWRTQQDHDGGEDSAWALASPPSLPPPQPQLAVTGIFEASVLAAVSLLLGRPADERWGIVTTGAFWEEHLTAGVRALIGRDGGQGRFAGVFSTGLDASDLHDHDGGGGVVDKIRAATTRLLNAGGTGGRVTCVVMGCAGMAGLEDSIRGAAEAHSGYDFAYGELHVVDAVRAGVMQVENMIKLYRTRGRIMPPRPV